MLIKNINGSWHKASSQIVFLLFNRSAEDIRFDYSNCFKNNWVNMEQRNVEIFTLTTSYFLVHIFLLISLETVS